MPMTSTKNFRLSSGFGVSISMWPRWARSKIGSGVMLVSPDDQNILGVVIPREGEVSSTLRLFGQPDLPGVTGSSAFADDDRCAEATEAPASRRRTVHRR